MRDQAISGLATLASREEWRSSPHGPSIIAFLGESETDVNPVVRMHAAQAFGTLHSDAAPAAQVARVGDWLAREPDPAVRYVLLQNLYFLAARASVEADDVMRRCADRESGNSLAQDADHRRDRDIKNVRGAQARIITYLALTHQTPYATKRLDNWASTAHESGDAARVVRHIRDYLRPGGGESQQRAFEFAATTAETCLAHLNSILVSHAGEQEFPPDLQEDVKRAVSALDHIANQVYFASGAYDIKNNAENDRQPPEMNQDNEKFAELAIPLLVTCSGTRAAPIVHHVAETLVYLAPLDERRALVAMSQAITTGGDYASDSISSDVVIPHLRRLLADERQLVLFDPQGVAAFRDLLAAFAAAGSEAALELAFTFAEVFR